jgi:hypothetical protein
MFNSDRTFVVPQSKCRDLPPRQRVVKFPTAMRFDTVWADGCRWVLAPQSRPSPRCGDHLLAAFGEHREPRLAAMKHHSSVPSHGHSDVVSTDEAAIHRGYKDCLIGQAAFVGACPSLFANFPLWRLSSTATPAIVTGRKEKSEM